MMANVRKGCLGLLTLIGVVLCFFWLYKQYTLKDFHFNEAVKTSKIIKIRENLYSIHNMNQYPILLMSEDMGKTWQEKHIRGIWQVFPSFSFLQLDSPIVDVVSIDKSIYIIEKSKYGSWDDTSGFYFAYKSTDEGKSWQSCFSFSSTALGATILTGKSNQYSIYDNETEIRHYFQQDLSEISKLKL